MSMRGTKRASVVRDGEQPSTSSAGPASSSSKRRRTDPDDPLWHLRPVTDLKMSSIYNRSASEAPAELFRKDLISAMKLPDNEPLTSSEYWVITDPWKQDWERGVQVPVNPDSLPAPKVKIIDNPMPPGRQHFKLPKDKYIHLARDAHYSPEKHELSTTPAAAEAACAYDLDANDACWLRLLNAERARAGAAAVTENQFEKVIEELEVRTWDKIQAIMKSEEGLGIEYDENVICDVCRSPDSEDGNEMVFCDSCNICVHQACYGITVIPDGQWLCRPCGDGVRPTCVLCPNQGGAMKCTPSGHKWAHVSCVLWIPEVSIGCAEKMEPITKISSIPASRWSLVCVLCRERKGACIQCSVKSCKTAYHVTCAFKHGLEMRAIIEDENADDGVKLRSYCQKHSVNSKKEKSGSGSEEEEVKRKRRKDMTSEEKTQARAARLHEIEKEFEKHVSVKDISAHLLDVDQDAINYIYNYWKLKRRSGHNRPLLPPKADDGELLSHRQEQADLDKMKMFVQLRQDLERVRNLCYMVSRREKLSRSFFRLREQTFHKQMAVLTRGDDIPRDELAAIYEANHGPSIYDTVYSHPDVPENKLRFDELLAKIAPPDAADDKKKERNGLRRAKANPYRKHYVNGARRAASVYSGLSSEESEPDAKYRASSTEDDDRKKAASPKKKVSPKAKTLKKSPRKNENNNNKKKKKAPQSKAVVESSSEEEPAKKDKSVSKTLRQMEKEMDGARSASDSDELVVPVRATRQAKFPVDIYSSSSEDSAGDRREQVERDDEKGGIDKSPSTSDAHQSQPRTKAAMKEFVPSHADKKEADDKPAPKKRGRKPSNKDKKPPVIAHESDDEAKNKENKFSKPKDNPTDLIVPQRQAAKKASENMRSTSTGKKEENAVEKSPEEVKVKSKGKGKGKEIKSPPAKLTRQTSKDAEKETIAYVPQRQAAKKAAAHIKNIGSKVPAPDAPDAAAGKKKEEEAAPVKKSGKESSSSSSSSSSSYSSSSSSSEAEPEKAGPKPAAKAREIKPTAAAKPPSVFSPPSARPTVDLPFLDKVSRPLSSTSAESDSESSRSGRSGSSSPTPRRPRRRRKRASGDASPPDKKLKTSERDGESPARASRAGAGASAGGGEPHVSDATGRSPAHADAAADAAATTQASRQSRELPPPERKAHKEGLNERRHFSPDKHRPSVVSRSPVLDPPKNDIKPKAGKVKRPNVAEEPPERRTSPPPEQPSPKKNAERRKSISSRRASVKEPLVKDAKDQVVPTAEEVIKPAKQRRQSRYEAREEKPSPTEPPPPPPPEQAPAEPALHDYNEAEKWPPKAPSPTHVLTPIERPGGDEKYMTDDKSFDAADVSTEKSSVRMIAKIQANLNENTMIKSPRTPMDARTAADEDTARHARKRGTLEAVTQQDASRVQGVEISKSAKIPTTYHERPPTSPQQKDNELFAFDMLAVDDGFNHDEIMKPFSSYPEFFFKEDSKEQGRQETLNLVDRLRMQLSAKKAPESRPQELVTDERNDGVDPYRPNDYGHDDYAHDEYREERVDEHKGPEVRLHEDEPSEHHLTNHVQHSIAPADMPRKLLEDDKGRVPDERWRAPPPLDDTAYDDKAASEAGDAVSKRSDDSLPSRSGAADYSQSEGAVRSPGDASSPYAGREAEWRESEIPRRRSSASSSGSEASAAAAGMPGIDSYPPVPAYSCPVEPSMPLNQYATYPPDASPFLSSMSSLFGSGACLPSPGPPYAPSLAYSSGLLPPEPPYQQLCAAFTSSSQNIALTTAMIAPPTPKPMDSPARDDSPHPPVDKLSLPAPSPSICVDSSTYEGSQSRTATKMTIDSDDTATVTSQEDKLPAKPTPPAHAAIKFPGKSPGKSPGISPRQSEGPKGSKRASNRSNRGARGRGRSKSRGQGHPYPPVDYLGDSIRNKLVGTVYDFDEEIANDGVDLKALRERRKSIDVRDDRRSEHSGKERSESPRVLSPPRRSPGGEGAARPEADCALVPPLLPGPVDMRTYQHEPAPDHRQLLAAADLEEEPPPPPAPPAPPAPPPPDLVPQLPKVSLSDSRNQLKVKIKGPFLDANYCASSAPVAAPPPAPAADPPLTFTPAGAASGSTSLRRMRKKELLRQYWTQDMNMDEPASAVVVPPAAPPPPRAVITIPKAVASMTSIPTREDYKILEPPPLDTKKKRKTGGGMTRELRHLKVTMNDEGETRRARLPKAVKAAPKLKIKLGSNTVQQVDEPSDFRPPKKRLVHKPSLEDLRRESMKYRKMVMADFEENEKTTKHKSAKSEKRKKKKDKKADKLQVVNSDGESAPKLIIKIKRPACEGEEESGTAERAVADPFDYDPSAPDPLALDAPSAEGLAAMRKVRTAKLTPIRLKLARTQGSSYVMAETGTAAPHAAPRAAPHVAPDDVR